MRFFHANFVLTEPTQTGYCCWSSTVLQDWLTYEDEVLTREPACMPACSNVSVMLQFESCEKSASPLFLTKIRSGMLQECCVLAYIHPLLTLTDP